MYHLKYKSYKKSVTYEGNLYQRERLSADEVHELLKKYNAWYLRSIYDFDKLDHGDMWHIIIDHPIEIDELPSKSTRKNLRKSLSVYEYKIVDKDEILRCGYRLFCERSVRLGIKPTLSEGEFVEYVDMVFEEGGDFWIGYDKESGEPAMWESIIVFDDNAVMARESLSYRYTKHNPTYGLNYSIVNYYLRDRGFLYVDAGAKSLSEHSNVQDFLVEKLQFRRAYCKCQAYFQPWLRLLLSLIYPFRRLAKPGSMLYSILALYQLSISDR